MAIIRKIFIFDTEDRDIFCRESFEDGDSYTESESEYWEVDEQVFNDNLQRIAFCDLSIPPSKCFGERHDSLPREDDKL